jgi:tetrahydromethanopterin S-methyltransferase subunit G
MDVVAPKKRWTGDRLDGLEKKVDEGFAQVGKRFEKVDEQFEEVDKRFDLVDAKFDTLEAKFDKKFDRLTYCILGSAAGIITTLIGIFAALIGPNVL